MEEFLKALHQKGYQGPVCVEPWNQGIQNMPLEDAIKTVKESLNHSLSFIKK